MAEPSKPTPARAMAKRIGLKVLWMFLGMSAFVLFVWGVAVWRSPSKTQHEQDETPRDEARDRKQPRRVAIPAPAPGNASDSNASLPTPLDINATLEYQPASFTAGERAEYYLWYLKAQVGTGAFEVAPRKIPGEPWRFTLKLSGMGGKFRYDARSVMDSGFSRSLSYEYTEQFPLSKPRTVRLDFNDANRTVTRHLQGNAGGSPIELPESYFDPLSMIYAFREMDFNAGQAVKWTVTDGKSRYTMSAEVMGRQQIKVGNREFRAILVEPDLGNFRGVFNQGEGSKMQIWFSDTADTQLLRLRFQTRIGEFTAEIK